MKVFKKLISAIIIGIMLVPTTIPVSAASKNLTVKEGEYYIESAVKSGQMVNTQGNKSDNGTNIMLYHLDYGSACTFKLVKSGNGYIIKTKSSNYKSALDVNGGSKASGTNVQEWKLNGGDSQLWYLRDAGDGYYYIVSALGCYLDVSGGKTADKTNIQVYKSNSGTAQKFNLIPVKAYDFKSESKWKNGITWSSSQKPKLSSYSSSGCCAYAADFFKYVFNKSSFSASGVSSSSSAKNIRSGDVIKVTNSQHWIAVLSRHGDTLYTAEGNWGGKVVISNSKYTVKNGVLCKDGSKFRTLSKVYHVTN